MGLVVKWVKTYEIPCLLGDEHPELSVSWVNSRIPTFLTHNQSSSSWSMFPMFRWGRRLWTKIRRRAKFNRFCMSVCSPLFWSVIVSFLMLETWKPVPKAMENIDHVCLGEGKPVQWLTIGSPIRLPYIAVMPHVGETFKSSICMYIYTYLYICIYIYTYTYTYIIKLVIHPMVSQWISIIYPTIPLWLLMKSTLVP